MDNFGEDGVKVAILCPETCGVRLVRDTGSGARKMAFSVFASTAFAKMRSRTGKKRARSFMVEVARLRGHVGADNIHVRPYCTLIARATYTMVPDCASYPLLPVQPRCRRSLFAIDNDLWLANARRARTLGTHQNAKNAGEWPKLNSRTAEQQNTFPRTLKQHHAIVVPPQPPPPSQVVRVDTIQSVILF